MPLSKTRFRKGVIIAADADALEGIEGEIKIDSADKKIKTTLNATPHEIVTNDQSQTLSNKTLTSPVINTGVSGSAIDTDVTLAANSDTLLASQKAVKAYVDTVAANQNEASEIVVTPAGTISSTNVQAALQELDTDIQNHLSDATDAHDASAISNVPAGSIAATDVQAAINELDTDIQNHITDTVDAHDASAISNVPSGNLAATDVQAALNELQGDIDTNTSGLSNHLSDTSDAHDASAISVVPTGNLAASDVQAALNELQGDADASNTHIAASTNVHGVGVGNSVVGTGTSQVLTNKTITGADIRTPVRSDVKQDTKANLTTYALTASNGQLVFATDTKEMFQVVDTLLEAVGGGGSGVGGVDILFSQTFEDAAITDFTQTGLSLSASSPIHGAISALMTHQAVANQSFKQVIAVDEKFRGQAMLLELNVKSTASAGNVTLTVRDETNAVNLVSSEQLTLSSTTGGIKDFVAFTIPATCLSLSYTVTALPQVGSPVTRIDDILCQLNNASLLETSVTVPNITSWQTYTPVITHDSGAASNYTAAGKWRQEGEDVLIQGSITFNSSSAAFSNVFVGFPNSYTIDSTKLSSTAALPILGSALVLDAGTALYVAEVLYNNSSRALIYLDVVTAHTGTVPVQVGGITNTTPITFNTGDAISFEFRFPAVGLTATSDVAIPLTQSGIVQEADSMIRLTTGNGYGSSATTIRRFVTIAENVGSDIQYTDSPTLGGRFTIGVSGIYNISFSDSNTGSADATLSIRINGVIIAIGRTGGEPGEYSDCVSASPLLKVNDVITFENGATPVYNAETFVTITRQGSLKQVTVNTNSKITIPTSELRFEGASSRGTGSDAAIVRFSTMAKIRGDAFTVVSDAALGTAVTMTKAGKLDIGVDIYRSSAGVLQITKNQTIRNTTSGIAAEILASGYTTGIDDTLSPSWSGFVNIGDVIRISMTTNPVSSVANILKLSFQEQDIQVSVSNTLPQFSESDSCVRLTGAAGFGSSATTIRRFASVVQNLGTDVEYIDNPILGGQFIAKASGIYTVSFSEASNANDVQMIMAIRLNGTNLAVDNQVYNTTSTADKRASVSWQGYLTVGDIITAFSNGNGAGSDFTMSKVGKPNVTGVDVTPFVNVPQPVTQSLFISQTTTTGAGANVTASPTSTSGDSTIFSYNASTGVYTVLKTANFSLNLSLRCSTAAAAIPLITINGVEAAVDYSVVSSGTWGSAGYSGLVQAGSLIVLKNAGGTCDQVRASVSATATSDQILTAPETFSTDTAALTYANAATYTLSTLANAPVGTYITYTYAINTNTRTQTTGTNRPTQTDADMNTNGMLIYTRAFNAASTAAQPAVIAIQIGKGMKGKSLDVYRVAGKDTAGSLDSALLGSAERGAIIKDYSEKSGILVVDTGVCMAGSTTYHDILYADLTGATSGYLVVNASKNPALTGFGLNRIAAKGVNSSGSIFGTTALTLSYNPVKVFDTHGALNAFTGIFTAPEDGYYQVNGSIFFTAATYALGSKAYIIGMKNNISHSIGSLIALPSGTFTTGATYSDIVFMSKGDTFKLLVVNERGSTPLISGTEANYFSIQKVSV